MIRAYRYFLSPLLGNHCRFHPSCSTYAMEALQTYGMFHGIFLTLKRLLRCHPWTQGGIDPIPEIKTNAHKYN